MNELVEKNFQPYVAKGITLNDIEGTYTAAGNLVRIKVINNEVIAFHGEKGAGFAMLEYLAKAYGLPDLDVIYLHSDGLSESLGAGAPILCSSKFKPIEQGIYFIDWFTTMPHPGWDDAVAKINKKVGETEWEAKKDQLIWRGATTDGWYTPSNWMNAGRRGRLCYLSTLYPDLINASFTNVHYCSNQDAVWNAIPHAPRMTLEDQLPYKYQIILDGVFSTYPGDRWRLLSNSVVFIPKSNIGHWFYDGLVPWVHYVPVKSDLSDLMEKYEMVRSDDFLARQLAYNAREFALNYLTSEGIAVYCYKVLLKYASLQRFTVK